MYTLCTTEKTTQQQRQFEQCFLQMMLESYYDDITVSELCRRAGLSRKIFYRLFEKKADVLISLVDHAVLTSAQLLPSKGAGPEGLYPFLNFWREQKDLLDALRKHQNSALLPGRTLDFAMYKDPSLARSFGAHTGKFAHETMIFYTAGIFSLILSWHYHCYSHSIEEMADLIIELLTSVPLKNLEST